ncbi:nucleotidyltransferase domain-containing protein [Ureibacillus aquaedulcis]|uniref:Nucleotidyltransferase domain-containing protein n=1 Tax=Ureibacillus aquaedulcis TaxID=3058421 RepID=A0ABT8GRQ8_9BACL|nr:nucleotidyltransferase domain-containing protein [Ureibacillus sp. BA0131]MDN4494088.1 nucleotidyltransferase domain-containing protein [Ureibacillus sp. BA0131]
MEEIIVEKLKEIEKQNHVKILFAVESGSRAWGFESAGSDYDVRFIYIHSPEWYLSIDPQGLGSKKDVMEYPFGGNLDINGWEITKALRLFRKSNPTILEWLRSKPIYFQNPLFAKRLHALEIDNFNPVPTIHHYFNLAMGNYKNYFQGKEVKIKIFLYVLKSILACVWVERNGSFPPVHIQDLLLVLDDEQIKREMEQLIKQKRSGENMVCIHDYQNAHDFINAKFLSIRQSLFIQKAELHNSTSQLDQLFRDTLSVVWCLKQG